jgi:ribosomal protein L37AE/L43A
MWCIGRGIKMSRYDLILRKPGLCEICERSAIYIRINGIYVCKNCYENYLKKGK